MTWPFQMFRHATPANLAFIITDVTNPLVTALSPLPPDMNTFNSPMLAQDRQGACTYNRQQTNKKSAK